VILTAGANTGHVLALVGVVVTRTS
jgi:hypothetical protein